MRFARSFAIIKQIRIYGGVYMIFLKALAVVLGLAFLLFGYFIYFKKKSQIAITSWTPRGKNLGHGWSRRIYP